MIEELKRLLDEASVDIVHVGAMLVRVLVIVLVAVILSHFLRGRIERSLARRSFGRNGALLVGRLFSLGILVVTLLAILGSFGAEWTGLLTVLGAGTVAVGLAIQDVLRNFVAGIFLLLERPFRVGDSIRVRDVEGEVQGIDIRTTLVKPADGSSVMIPNAVVFTEVLTNRSRSGQRRVDLAIDLPAESLDDLERTIADALRAVPGLHEPFGPPVLLTISRDTATLELPLTVDAASGAESGAVRALGAALRDASISVKRS